MWVFHVVYLSFVFLFFVLLSMLCAVLGQFLHIFLGKIFLLVKHGRCAFSPLHWRHINFFGQDFTKFPFLTGIEVFEILLILPIAISTNWHSVIRISGNISWPEIPCPRIISRMPTPHFGGSYIYFPYFCLCFCLF